MRKRTFTAVFLTVTCCLATLPIAASADQSDGPIDKTVVQADGTVLEITETAATDKTPGSVSVSTQPTPPTPEQQRQQIAEGRTTILQDTRWFEPKCDWPKLEDGRGIGWMANICSQWGRMDYEGATRDNWAFRLSASCAAKEGGPDLWAVKFCEVGTNEDNWGGMLPPQVMNAKSPTSRTQLQPCGSVSLSISAGPVGAGYSVNTCEELVPMFLEENRPGLHGAMWRGVSYWADDIRETGMLIGIGMPRGWRPSLFLRWAYGYDLI